MTLTSSVTVDTRPPARVIPTPQAEGDLARLLLQPVRLGILRSLLAHPTLSFTELKRLIKISDGNLSVHARKLEDAQFLVCTKGFRGRLPRTEYSLTAQGRAVVEKFLAEETRGGA
jgi:DNA-binding HxlR family transcriptional regulator